MKKGLGLEEVRLKPEEVRNLINLVGGNVHGEDPYFQNIPSARYFWGSGDRNTRFPILNANYAAPEVFVLNEQLKNGVLTVRLVKFLEYGVTDEAVSPRFLNQLRPNPISQLHLTETAKKAETRSRFDRWWAVDCYQSNHPIILMPPIAVAQKGVIRP